MKLTEFELLEEELIMENSTDIIIENKETQQFILFVDEFGNEQFMHIFYDEDDDYSHNFHSDSIWEMSDSYTEWYKSHKSSHGIKTTLKQLAVKHDYYASDSCFDNKDAHFIYETWKDFYKEYAKADTDMNLVVRWDIEEDIEEDENGNEVGTGEFSMLIIIVGQRKGMYIPRIINRIEEEDVPQIKEYLKRSFIDLESFDKLMSIWQPLSTEFLK